MCSKGCPQTQNTLILRKKKQNRLSCMSKYVVFVNLLELVLSGVIWRSQGRGQIHFIKVAHVNVL